MDIKKLYDSYVKDIFRYSLFKLRNKEEAEDVTSEVFSRVIEKGDLREIKDVKTWLIGMARNIVYDKYNDRSRYSEINEIFDKDESTSVDEQVIPEDLKLKVKDALNTLDDLTREVIVLKNWEDLKFKEIGEITNLNENTVKTIYYKGLDKIKGMVEKKRKSITAGIILSGILNYKNASEFTASTEFASTIVTKLENASLIINAPIMQGNILTTIVTKLGGLKTLIVTKPLATLAVVTGTAITAGGVVVTQSLLSPIGIDSQGNLQSNAIIKQYDAEITLRSEGFEETFKCGSDGCEDEFDNVDDGEYDATIKFYNLFGQVVNTEEKKITIDNTAPTLEIIAPTATNKQELEIEIKSEEGVIVFINNEEQTLNSGKLNLNIADGENKFNIRVVDEYGNETSKEINVIYDTTIELTVSEPIEGAEVDSPFNIVGVTDAGATVTSQGLSAVADENGAFTISVPYTTDAVIVTSTDVAGNTISKTVNVKKKAPTTITIKGKRNNYEFTYPITLGSAIYSVDNSDGYALDQWNIGGTGRNKLKIKSNFRYLPDGEQLAFDVLAQYNITSDYGVPVYVRVFRQNTIIEHPEYKTGDIVVQFYTASEQFGPSAAKPVGCQSLWGAIYGSQSSRTTMENTVKSLVKTIKVNYNPTCS